MLRKVNTAIESILDAIAPLEIGAFVRGVKQRRGAFYMAKIGREGWLYFEPSMVHTLPQVICVE